MAARDSGKELAPRLLTGRVLCREWRRDGPFFGAHVGNQLGDLRVGERVAEGRHLLPTVEDLAGDFGWGPVFVGADAYEAGGFFAADAADAVAMGAAGVAEKDCAGLLVGLGFGGQDEVSGQKGEEQYCREKGERSRTSTHVEYFRI